MSLELKEKIISLKKEMNAIILAHYYQIDEIQEIADFIGDSLDLSKKSQTTQADVIIFCGVKFMAEVAKILNPTKKVLIPDLTAGCSLEYSCRPLEFSLFKEKYPEHIVISYINCSAEIKALSDIIVTSSNAEKIINSVPLDQEIIFAPDQHLGRYLIKKTGRNMILWHGSCIVHENFSEKELIKTKIKNPHAKIIAHPECAENLLNYADYIGSTSNLLKYVQTNQDSAYIVLTESGILYKMKQLSPLSSFITLSSIEKSGDGCTNCSICDFMKKNTIEKLYNAMSNSYPEINLDPQIAVKASKSLNKMMELSAL